MRNISLLTFILVSTSLLSKFHHHAHAEAIHGLPSQEFGSRLLRRYGGGLEEGDSWVNKRYPVVMLSGLQERAELDKPKGKKKDDDPNNLPKGKKIVVPKVIKDDPKEIKDNPKEVKNPAKDPIPKVDKDKDKDPIPPKVDPIPKENKDPNPKEDNRPPGKKPKKTENVKEVKVPKVQEQKNKEDAANTDQSDESAGQIGATPVVKTGDMSPQAVAGLVSVGAVFAVVTGLLAFVRRKKNKEMTKSIMSTSATAWEQQNIPHEEIIEETKPIGSYTVVATYTPALADELDIQPGDKVTIIVEYDDGWVQGINETRGGTKGVFPRHCVDMNTALNDKRSSSIGGYTIVNLD